jgi:hypothetical protein
MYREWDNEGPSTISTMTLGTAQSWELEILKYLITRGTMEVLDPVDEGYTSTSGFEADSDDSEFEPDADELAVAANYEKRKARGKGVEQDSGKILLCQTHLAYPRKAATQPSKENEDSIDKEGDSNNTKRSTLGHPFDLRSHLNWVT